MTKLSDAHKLLPDLADNQSSTGFEGRAEIEDVFIRAHALARILEVSDAMAPRTVAMALDIARHSEFLREGLVDTFLHKGRFEWVDRLMAIEAEDSRPGGADELLPAMVEGRFEEQMRAHERRFLAHGDPAELQNAAVLAERQFGWRRAWPIYLRLLFVEAPPHTDTALRVLRMLEREGSRSAFDEFGQLCRDLEGCQIPALFWKSYTTYWEGDWERCLRILDQSGVKQTSGSVFALFEHLYALCLERLGRAREAAASFQRQNDALKDDRYTFEGFVRTVKRQGELPVPPLEADPNDNYFIMTGCWHRPLKSLKHRFEMSPRTNDPRSCKFSRLETGDDDPRGLFDDNREIQTGRIH